MRTPDNLPASLAQALARVGRRRRLQALVAAACWAALGGALLVAVAPLAAGLDGVPGWLVWLARCWLMVWLVVPLAVLVVPPWRRTATALQLARAVDDRVPETRDGLMVAVDLAGALDAGRLRDDPITLHLARDTIHAAAAQANRVRPAELLPWSRLGRSVLLGPLAAGLAAAALSMAPGPFVVGLEALLLTPARTAAADAEPEREDELPVTLTLRNVVVTLEPPAYTGREPLILEGTSGDFRALPGTAVTLEADLPAGGSEATVAWSGEEDPPPEWTAPVRDEALSIRFVTPGAGGYRVLLNRGRLREPLRSRLFRVEALPDDPPDLEVTGPPGDLELHPADELSLVVRSSDDFALSKLELTVVKANRVIARVPIGSVEGLSHFEDVVRWSPLELGTGGDLELVVEAWDNDTVNGPKVTRSRPLDVYVPTAEDHHRRVLASKRRLLDQALDLLADLLVANHRAEETLERDALTDAFDHQDRLARGFFETARELAAAMEQDQYEREAVYAGIGQLTENLARRWELVREVVETRVRHAPGASVPTSTVRALVEARRGTVAELEQIVLDLAAFIDLQVGDRIAAEMAELDAGMADMAELLRKAEDGQPVDEELARALQELEQQLLELSRELGERSRGPDDGFANQLPQDLGQDLLSELQDLIEQGRHAEAMERLQQAMETVAEMREGLQKESEEWAGGQLASQLQAQMEDAMARADELARQQQEVIDATEELERRVGGADGMGEDERQELLEDMDRLQEMVTGLPPEGMDPAARGSMREWTRPAGRSASRMRDAFAGGDREAALEYAAEAAAYLDEAAVEVAQAERQGFREGIRQAKEETRQAGRLADDIADRLSRAEQRARRAQSRASSESGPIQEQQTGVRQGVRELQEQLQQMGSSAFNPASGRANLESAGQMMERATGRLSQGRTGPALQSERDALQQLQSFQESMQQARQAMQGQGRGSGQRRGMMAGNPWQRLDRHDGWEDGGEVEMPDPEDFVSPEAWRALVQEEAGGDAPERYKPLTGSYYEEIVR